MARASQDDPTLGGRTRSFDVCRPCWGKGRSRSPRLGQRYRPISRQSSMLGANQTPKGPASSATATVPP